MGLVASGLIALAAGLLGLLGGAVMGARLLGRRPVSVEVPDVVAQVDGPERGAEPCAVARPEPAEAPPHVLSLIARSMRTVLQNLRAHEVPDTALEGLERLAWQARMLAARRRPLQAQPSSPISLIQEAAEQVEPLRLGKVATTWGLRTRQPVHVDAERARGAFRELLAGAAEAVGEGGRLAVRVGQGEPPYPVKVEIEIGRRGSDVDSLPFLVARHLLESQGARVELDGEVLGVHLRSLPPEEDGGP